MILNDPQATPAPYHATMAMIHLSGSMHRQIALNANALVLEHRGRAMEAVRALLARDDIRLSEALIIAITSLATVESALGNIKSYKLHLSALRLLEQEKGHMTLSPGRTVGDVLALYSDTTLSLKTGKSTFKRRRHEAVYLCRPLPADVCLPLGFAALLRQLPMSQDIVSALVNACRFGLGVHCVNLTDLQKVSLARRRKASRKYRNYMDSVPILLVPDNPDVFFEKMLVLALSLFAWCGFTAVRIPQFGLYNAMVTQLMERLVIFHPTTQTERKCAAWMWLMAIDAWRIGASDGTVLPQGQDVLWQFHQRFMEFQSWTNVRKLTKLFFWTGDMDKFWSQRWEQLSTEVLSQKVPPRTAPLPSI